MHKETNRFKTYTQLEKTYRKILVRRWPRQHGRPRIFSPLTKGRFTSRAFLINGVVLSGAEPKETFAWMTDQELSQKQPR